MKNPSNPKKYMVMAMTLPMVAEPVDADNPHPPLTSQLLFGEMVSILAEDKGWAKVAGVDGYEGYVLRQALTDHEQWLRGDEYILARNMATIYFDADIKSTPLQMLFYPARVRVVAKKEKDKRNFVELASGGYVLANHLRPVNDKQSALAVARMMLGAPYLWGGRSFAGTDCSGLTQMAYASAGIALPRDSGLQFDFLKTPIDEKNRQAGDLVFWAGHVAMMLDNDSIIHSSANPNDMMVTIDNYTETRARLEKDGTAFRGIKRA
ncbi:MAG: C40 family peptidase [Hydrotalea sp.]|nr:C40 family peptidase [Hydrotalea sp.]